MRRRPAMAGLQLGIEDAIRKSAFVLAGAPDDYTALQRLLRNKSFVLLGEATHGTHDFYQARVAITKQLITEHGLSAIAIEGDWPSAYRGNRYVRWQGSDQSADEALSDFRRFPMWMWRNTVIQEFVDWLREHNRALPYNRQVGFYGLDMYSLYESAAAVVQYLEQVDPQAAEQARRRYGCLEHVSNERHYGYGVTLGRHSSCEEEVIKQLQELRNKAFSYLKGDGMAAEDELFQAEQNARLVQSAEAYYRQMFSSRINTWNLRDSHMSETLDNLHVHLSKRLGHSARIAVWAHNSHLGDAAPRIWADGVSIMWVSWRASAMPVIACWSVSRPIGGQYPLLRNGTGRWSASGYGRRCRAALRRSCTGLIWSVSFCPCMEKWQNPWESLVSSGPSVCCTCRSRSGPAIISGVG